MGLVSCLFPPQVSGVKNASLQLPAFRPLPLGAVQPSGLNQLLFLIVHATTWYCGVTLLMLLGASIHVEACLLGTSLLQ